MTLYRLLKSVILFLLSSGKVNGTREENLTKTLLQLGWKNIQIVTDKPMLHTETVNLTKMIKHTQWSGISMSISQHIHETPDKNVLVLISPSQELLVKAFDAYPKPYSVMVVGAQLPTAYSKPIDTQKTIGFLFIDIFFSR